MKGVSKRRSTRKTSYVRNSPKNTLSKRRSIRKSAKRSTRKSAKRSPKRNAKRSAKRSTRKTGKKCSCCGYVRCRCPKNCKYCKCNMKGGAKKSMDVEVRPRSTRRSATKANISLSEPRKQREKRAEKIKITKEFKKELDVEIDRLADLMGTNNKYAITDTINQVAELGMLMGNMGFTPSRSSSSLPPAKFTFNRQPSKTEYTAEDVMTRFRS
jgi:hypothetical protein